MKKWLFSRSNFTLNILTLISGTGIAQLISILSSPILTRIYTPSDFGFYALLMSISCILGVFTSGQYHHAIMLPKKNSQSFSILYLILIISIIIGLLAPVLLLAVPLNIAPINKLRQIPYAWVLITLTVLPTTGLQSLKMYFARNKQFKEISLNEIYLNCLTIIFSIILSVSIIDTINGLITARCIALLISLYILLQKLKNIKQYTFHLNEVVYVLKKYSNFPKFTIGQALFSSISLEMPTLMISLYFSTKMAGFYFLARRISALPVTIISESMYQVFFQEFTSSSNKKILFKQKFKHVNVIFAPIFILAWLIAPFAFQCIFSDEWYNSGVYTQSLIPLLYFQFISNLFAMPCYIAYEKQKENLIWSIASCSTIFVTMLIGIEYQSIVLALNLMAATNIVIICIKLFRAYQFIDEEKNFLNNVIKQKC